MINGVMLCKSNQKASCLNLCCSVRSFLIGITSKLFIIINLVVDVYKAYHAVQVMVILRLGYVLMREYMKMILSGGMLVLMVSYQAAINYIRDVSGGTVAPSSLLN